MIRAAWLLGSLLGVVAAIGVSLYSPPAQGGPQGLRPMDHPRCFPPGTLGVESFLACPDGLPDQRAA